MTPQLLIEQVLNGLVLGSMYALVASGLSLIYGTMRILNFAHGELFMVGGFGVSLAIAAGLSPWLAIPLAGLLSAAVGWFSYRWVLAPLNQQQGGMFATITVTLGLSIFLQNLALKLWGAQFQTVPYFVEGVWQWGEVRLPWQRALILVFSLGALAVSAAVLRYTPFGRAVRATAQDSEAARVLGVPVRRIQTGTFALGALLAGCAAAVLAPIYAVNPWMGVSVSLKAFVVVVLGGLGSFSGAIVAGLVLGVIEALGVALTSSEWRDVISYTLLIAIIWVRPWGLFGVAER